MNLGKLTKTQLRRVARKVGIKISSTEKKKDILKKLLTPLGHYSMNPTYFNRSITKGRFVKCPKVPDDVVSQDPCLICENCSDRIIDDDLDSFVVMDSCDACENTDTFYRQTSKAISGLETAMAQSLLDLPSEIDTQRYYRETQEMIPIIFMKKYRSLRKSLSLENAIFYTCQEIVQQYPGLCDSINSRIKNTTDSRIKNIFRHIKNYCESGAGIQFPEVPTTKLPTGKSVRKKSAVGIKV